MCTVTYLPVSPKEFFITHSRDESAVRETARPPGLLGPEALNIVGPQDPRGQGTWIATNGPVTACILNGAFVSHLGQPRYQHFKARHSRGLVPLHFYGYPSTDAFFTNYDFEHIEPFTLLIAETGRLSEVIWDGDQAYWREKNSAAPHIWSSVTLYPPLVVEKREEWFRNWLVQNPSPAVEEVRQFHCTAGDGDETNSLRMNRQGTLLTISLTSVVHQQKGTEIIYEDLMLNTVFRQKLHFPG